MDTVIAITYSNLDLAKRAIAELGALHSEKVLLVSDVVVVELDKDGMVRSHVIDPNASPAGSFLRHALETIGFSIDVMLDRKIDDATIETIVRKAHADSATLGIVAENLDIYRLSAGLAKFGGEVIYSNLSLDDELKLVEAISKTRDRDEDDDA